MKRKTHVLVVSALNAVKHRNRAGFSFSGDPRAVMVTIDRKLALEADSDLKIYKPDSDHYKRATGKEEMPNSLAKQMNDGLRKLHTTAVAESDYQRSIDSIRNELEMMGEEGVELVAKDLKIKAAKDESLVDAVANTLLQLEAEPMEIEPADDAPEEDEDDDLDEEKVQARFKELDAMSPEALVAALDAHGYEDEGDKAGKILAILTEEFGEEVSDVQLPEVTEADSDDDEGYESDDEDKGGDGQPAAKKEAPKGKKKAAPKAAKKK